MFSEAAVLEAAHLAAAVLAAFRLTELMTVDRITEPIRRRWPVYLWTCLRCVSVWAGIVAPIVFVMWPWANWPLAISYFYIVWAEARERRRQGRGVWQPMQPIAGGADLWSGIIDPGRAVTWENVGVTGGILIRSTICQTFLSATAVQIQTALDSPACQNAVVKLAPGTFNLSTGLTIPSNVTLRGSGANLTILNFTGFNSHGWGSYFIGFVGFYDINQIASLPGCAALPDSCKGKSPTATTRTWVGTNGASGVYTKGATVLNLGSVPTGLLVGDMLFLYQDNDPDASVPATNYFVSAKNPGVAREGGDAAGHRQAVKVTAISGTQVTVTPGIYLGDIWKTGNNPRAFWWGSDTRLAGLEDLAVTTANTVTHAGIALFQASDCWISGVRVKVATDLGAGLNTRDGIWPLFTRNITIRDSYVQRMVGGGSGSTTSYGVEPNFSSSGLIQNNIIFEVESPILFSAGTSGYVTAYNYETAVAAAGAERTGILSHEVHAHAHLYEGNSITQMRCDTFHGDNGFGTAFRNRFHGNNGAPPVDIWSYGRNWNVVGNVLGTAANQTRYTCTADTSSICDRFAAPGAIYRLGYPGGGANNSEAGVANDPQVAATIMRWGNYDVVNATNQFLPSEVPTTAQYPNAVPGSQFLPPSFYLSAQPTTWWGTPWGIPAWPAIGPDVPGGDLPGVAGHAYKIPAQLCYENLTAANFNAATCYIGGTPPLPPPVAAIRGLVA